MTGGPDAALVAGLSRTDGARNRQVIQAALDRHGSAALPPWSLPLDGGLVLGEGQELAGAPGTVLDATGASGDPVLHLTGSRTAVADVTVRLPCQDPGIHDGARHTAITVGDYLYPARPRWIRDVTLRRIAVERPGPCAANSIAVMGAVSAAVLHDIDVHGGGTGVAVHWGAVGTSVSTLSGPSFHPHDLDIGGLRVTEAFEGFYLSSVHDVRVTGVVADDVAIGFRLLPGDNADFYHEDPQRREVGARIAIREVRARFHGPYGIRIAAWGRSEVDHRVRHLAYRDVTIGSCLLTAAPATDDGRRAAVVLERVAGVTFDDVRLGAGAPVGEVLLDGAPAGLAALAGAPVPSAAGDHSVDRPA